MSLRRRPHGPVLPPDGRVAAAAGRTRADGGARADRARGAVARSARRAVRANPAAAHRVRADHGAVPTLVASTSAAAVRRSVSLPNLGGVNRSS